MTREVIKMLQADELTDTHSALLDKCKALVKRSRCDMARRYSDWDNQDLIYRGIKSLDQEDVKAARQGKPVKMILPNTFAQAQTFVSFLFLTFTQNRRMFELVAKGAADGGRKQDDIETVIEHDLRFNNWSQVLYQKLLDTARFGPGITECMWERKTIRARVSTPEVVSPLGVTIPSRPGSEWQEFVKFEGNRVRPVSPYRFFPDTCFPLTEFQRGEFCAVEEEYSVGSLFTMQAAGEVAGIDKIPPLPRGWAKARGAETRSMVDFTAKNAFTNQGSNPSGTVLVTKCQVRIVPSQFIVEGNRKLGPEEFEILYNIWYANDSRLIKVEPAFWWHDKFSWTVCQYTPDMQHTLNLGMADMIYRLQEVISWLYNSRITDVRRNIRGRNIINPGLIDPKTYHSDGDIYMRTGVNGALIDRAIKPLDVNEVTASHVQDAQLLSQVMEVITGINGNAMGQYSSGRRSAEQTRVVTAGAAGRLRMHAHLIFADGLAPLAEMMMSNSRQSLPADMFARIVDDPDPARYAAFAGTPEEVIAGTDYFTFDSTLQSEKGYVANALQELLTVIMSNPMAASQFNIDPRLIFDEIMFLRGVGNIGRFSPERAAALGLPPMLPPQVPEEVPA